MAEEDTALSIIDPMKISIDLNANPIPEPCFTKSAAGMGLLAVPETQMRQLLLEVSLLGNGHSHRRELLPICILQKVRTLYPNPEYPVSDTSGNELKMMNIIIPALKIRNKG